jgi:hypothetical protein
MVVVETGVETAPLSRSPSKQIKTRERREEETESREKKTKTKTKTKTTQSPGAFEKKNNLNKK